MSERVGSRIEVPCGDERHMGGVITSVLETGEGRHSFRVRRDDGIEVYYVPWTGVTIACVPLLDDQ